ncbi:hypothetical protein [Pseudoduganella sp. R-34]|uniref:hypothetical protein n=1 Tax=Pseudoduganella sp. R-34 TaxID=3404062 RepID=UPI003CEC3DF6
MANEYFVASLDEPITERRPVRVFALSSEEAIQRYLAEVYALDGGFRSWVLATDLAYSFLGHVCKGLKTPQRLKGSVCLAELKSFIEKYFRSAPALGALYRKYLETGDPSIVNEDIFVFIARNQTEGFLAIRSDEIQSL